MEPIGINSNVFAGGKMYHIQTAGHFENLSIKSEIWETGRVIYVERTRVESRTGIPVTPDEFTDYMNAFHQEVGWEIELLYLIRDKVRSIKHAVSSNKMGLVMLNRGMTQEAIAEFNYALECQPDMIDTIKNLGLAHLQLKEYAKAMQYMKKAAELAPNYPDIRHYTGVIQFYEKHYAEAVRWFQEALDVNPNYADALLYRAQALIESCIHEPDQPVLGPPSVRRKKASEHLQAFLALQPSQEDEPAIHALVRQALSQIQDDALAMALKTIGEIRAQVKKVTVDEMMHTFYLKFLFGGAGKDEKILVKYQQQLEKTIVQNPKFADVHNTLGLVYLVQCRNLFLKAAGQFKKASDINPSFKAAYRNYRLVQNDGREFLNLLRAILK